MSSNLVASQPSSTGEPAEYDISVVIALEDHRGQWFESILSLAQRQTFPRARYEVIIVSDGEHPELEERARQLLGSQDSLLRCAATDELMLYDFGARQAKGRFIFFGEAHCIAAEDCLSEMCKFLSGTELAGANCNVSNHWHSYIGELAARLHEEDASTWYDGGYTHRLWLAAAAIRRDVYLEQGGLSSRYQMFADRAFGINLHMHGFKIGFAAEARARHFFVDSLQAFVKFIGSYTLGEDRYRSDFSESHCQRYLGNSTDWLERHYINPSIARTRFAALLQFVMVQINKNLFQPAAIAALPALLETWLAHRFGSALPLFRARLRIAKSVLRLWWWRFFDRERSFRAFRQLILLDVVHYYRLKHSAESACAVQCDSRFEFDMAEDLPEQCLGFYPLEHTEQKRSYRFTQRISILQVAMPSDSYRVDLEMVECRPAQLEPYLMVFFDDKRLRVCSPPHTPGRISFLLAKECFDPDRQSHSLALVCDPFLPRTYGSEDNRELGLAISSIRFQPQEPERSLAGADSLEAHTN